ncbi:hypothetical protein I5I81_01665 [Pseudomonas aeruginosa]|uniref:hypothetical protein n=1 Tax=Pseudomonas aeruginosa TaxID=287 RepID=UPI000BB8E402|nr:hypothetical protein [Pseudomonas aeruginosa]MBG6673498.1 hypothetical protein [Pseudomonas aeruginosa]MBG6741515.1 hypothetical protein [Pseudomonas aeruginosa]MBG6858447.1 hypothetical protein [Pseudomonas aeruginosa]PCB49824.1 hypothetical protein CJT88_06765 [Pseudomonas aeruginosa]HCL4240795.1 hypothetical protein [Pseudomonas aeruginosa]
MPLTKDRNTQRRDGVQFNDPVAASTRIFAGSLMCLNAAGNAVPGSLSATLKARGVAQEQVDNRDGAAGDLRIESRRGVFQFANSASTDEITRADIGNECFIVDDQTVAKTSATNTRSVAGIIRDLDEAGVWVEI